VLFINSTPPAFYGTNNLKSSINPKEAKYCLKLKKKVYNENPLSYVAIFNCMKVEAEKITKVSFLPEI